MAGYSLFVLKVPLNTNQPSAVKECHELSGILHCLESGHPEFRQDRLDNNC